VVKVVHCIDAEGPLEETPEVRATLTSKPCFPTWAELEQHLGVLTKRKGSYCDTQGNPPRFSWFIADNIGWVDNPRRKATGQHAVYDRILPYVSPEDSIGWHFHAVSPRRRALEYSTTWTTHLPIAEEALCRRLLERGTFPSTFRAGGAVMRPDLAAWLDLFIPFDYSTHPPVGGPGDAMDWRAPVDGKRIQVLTPELDSISYHMTTDDVERVFSIDAVMPGAGVLAYAGHDRRSVLSDLSLATGLVTKVAAGRPWQWANAQEALRNDYRPVPWVLKERDSVTFFTTNQLIYGSPFLAVADGDLVYRDNPTQEDAMTWAFRIPPGAKVAIAAWPAL